MRGIVNLKPMTFRRTEAIQEGLRKHVELNVRWLKLNLLVF